MGKLHGLHGLFIMYQYNNFCQSKDYTLDSTPSPRPLQSRADYIIMSRWRSSVEELAARHRQQGECQRGQEALSRVTSCFQQLAASLGSSADGSFLRGELEETRGLVERLSRGEVPVWTLVSLFVQPTH